MHVDGTEHLKTLNSLQAMTGLFIARRWRATCLFRDRRGSMAQALARGENQSPTPVQC